VHKQQLHARTRAHTQQQMNDSYDINKSKSHNITRMISAYKQSEVRRHTYTRAVHAHITRTTLITHKHKQPTLTHMQQTHIY